MLISQKHLRAGQRNSNDYQVYKSPVPQTKAARPHATWKWKHMLIKMVIAGERIAEEESEDTDDADSVESYPDMALHRR